MSQNTPNSPNKLLSGVLHYKEFYLSEEKFNSLYPRAIENTYFYLRDLLLRNKIDTKDRIFMFIAQCGHESAGFSVTTENLNYSEKALLSVFGKYFGNPPKANANQYARKPEKIANLVYANRMGNGPESSGDGWKYRGRGFIQLTGKNNYEIFQKDMNIELPDVNLVANVELAVLSAVWYWNKNNLNRFADVKDIKGCTRAINGGYNGLDDREKQYNRLYQI